MVDRVAIFTANRAERGLLEPVYQALIEAGISASWCDVELGPTISLKYLSPIINGFHAAVEYWREAYAMNRIWDIAIVPTDRIEMVGVALYLFTKNLPFAHFHAGDTGSGTHDEVFRFIISRCASLHFCETQQSADTLFKLGEEAWRVKVVGSTAFDNVRIDYGLVPGPRPFDLVLIHPDTYSKEQTHKDILQALSMVDKHAIIIGPNHDTNWEVIDMGIKNWIVGRKSYELYLDGVSRPQFHGLMEKCQRFITNSSSAMYEAPRFNTNVVNIGERNKNRKPVDVQTGGSQKIAKILKDLVVRETLLRKKFAY